MTALSCGVVVMQSSPNVNRGHFSCGEVVTGFVTDCRDRRAELIVPK